MNNRGISLIEVLIAFAIITIVFVALAMSQVLGFRVTHDSVQVAEARDIATEQLEIIRGFGFPYYQTCPDTDPTVGPACQNASFPAGDTVANHNAYTMRWNITNAPVDEAGNPINPSGTDGGVALVGVEVVVSWRDDSYVLSTFLSCADADEFSSSTVPCPKGSLR